jgi:hypothetical protein
MCCGCKSTPEQSVVWGMERFDGAFLYRNSAPEQELALNLEVIQSETKTENDLSLNSESSPPYNPKQRIGKKSTISILSVPEHSL